jgi:hypothetical protein
MLLAGPLHAQNSRGTLRGTVQDGGCLLGELFGNVNGVCDPLHPLAPGDNGPSGEDITHRFVLAGSLRIPGGIELTTMTQAESACPSPLQTPPIPVVFR